VGKSTLLRQLLPDLRLRGVAMVAGRALESESRAAYGPWAELVLALHELGLAPIGPWPLLERLVPALRSGAATSPVAPLDPAQGHQLLQELVRFLRVASESRPLTLLLEDMHWADAASWDALEYVMAQLTTERIFVVLSLRSEEATYGMVRERRQRLSRDERSRELRVERLDAREVCEWLQGALHRSELGEDLLTFVLQRTEGNPFLVMQLLRAMNEAGVFTNTGSAWVWTIPASLPLPTGMSDLVARRLSRLPPEASKILVIAAAIGRTFSLSLLADAAGAEMDAVLDAVDSGLATSVLEPVHEQDDDTYRFAHALLVDAVLHTVSTARQRMIHRRIADLLAARSPDAVDAVAWHYARSGDGSQTYTWCRSAAERAMSRYALDDATRFLELALEHAGAEDQRVAAQDELAFSSSRWSTRARKTNASPPRTSWRALPSSPAGGTKSRAGAMRCSAVRSSPRSRCARSPCCSVVCTRWCALGRRRRTPRPPVVTCSRSPSARGRAPMWCRSARCSCRRWRAWGAPRKRWTLPPSRCRSPKRVATTRWCARRCTASGSPSLPRVRAKPWNCCCGSCRVPALAAIAPWKHAPSCRSAWPAPARETIAVVPRHSAPRSAWRAPRTRSTSPPARR
jgi:hypothetical protein